MACCDTTTTPPQRSTVVTHPLIPACFDLDQLSCPGKTSTIQGTATTGADADAHEADTMAAPAWGFSGSRPASPLRGNAEIRMQVELLGAVGRSVNRNSPKLYDGSPERQAVCWHPAMRIRQSICLRGHRHGRASPRAINATPPPQKQIPGRSPEAAARVLTTTST